MSDIMVDIETLGSDPGSVILSIGAVSFTSPDMCEESVSPWVGNEFYRTIDIFSCLMHGLTINHETVKWWREQSDEAKIAAQPIGGVVTLSRALAEFAKYVRGHGLPRVWAKGPDFDLVVLHSAYKAVGLAVPWQYRNARDVRTIYDLAGGIKEPTNGVDHSALDDAKNQAQGVILAYNQIRRQS